MGTMPVSEWSLRQKKEWPSPARRGCTPRSGRRGRRGWRCGGGHGDSFEIVMSALCGMEYKCSSADYSALRLASVKESERVLCGYR